MSCTISTLAGFFLKSTVILLAANEIRGLVLAGPVLYAMYEVGGTSMAIWIGVSSLSGIALSVIGPIILIGKLNPARATP